ncbi:MAG: phosphate acyltransferase PlsX [Clostridiales bacterium]|nr:phosphate acyltransferase PlsX [Clostridiales bacterium]
MDAMGGDNAPRSNVEGAVEAVRELGVEAVLVGRGDEILSVLKDLGCDAPPPGIEIVHTSEVVTMEDNPATAFKEKKDSSLTVGLELVKEGKGDAFVSAGSTGALLSAATLLTKRIRGIRRAALAPQVPTPNGGAILIDAGATAECTPEYLLQYAFMGSYYAEHIMGRPEPRVGLLNIGAEEGKGTELQRETYALLKKAGEEGRIHFTGNVEARDAVLGAVDVIVCDGYSGNIFLKTLEGTALFLSGELKKMFKKNPATKLSALMVSGGLRDFKKMMDSREVGGTPLLGISKAVIKAHGSSDAYAVKNAIAQAARFAGSGIIENITENIDYMKLPVRRGEEKI